MMTKKEYERAAKIVGSHVKALGTSDRADLIEQHMTEGFVAFFRGDNPKFDAERFRAACEES